MHPRKLDLILSAEGELQPLLTKAHELRTLAQLVHSFLSAEFDGAARVANYKDSQLVLLATDSAAAAKLKLLAPALGRFLNERRWQVNSVSVRVQPNRARVQAEPRKSVQLSTDALQALRRLHSTMPPGPARRALARLLQRRGALRRRRDDAD